MQKSKEVLTFTENNPVMVVLYSSSENVKRLNYIAKHIFNAVLGIDFEIIAEKSLFLQATGVCINYSDEVLSHGLQIVPHGLLAGNGVRAVDDLQETEWKGLFAFFKRDRGDIPFDIFAASFYLLTLYEEYFPKRLDRHDRFPCEEALSYRKGFLEIPIIDRWAYLLKAELEEKGFDTSSFLLRKFRAVSTFDVDLPFLYRNKGLIKNVGGAARDLLQGKWKNLANRLPVLFHLKQDPYFEALQWIDAIQKQFDRSYYLFVLIAGKSPYDRKTIYPPRRFYNYLNRLQGVRIGLHPSYLTLRNLKRLMKEKSKLEHILGKKVTDSRQHFLRMQNPETFQELNLAGLREDFTLAFAQTPGFRSGTAVPHYFYDLENEEETELLIRPTIMMDSTFLFHQKMRPEAAMRKIMGLIDACKESGGDYLSLWHNSNLADDGEENLWREVFIHSYDYAISLENTYL